MKSAVKSLDAMPEEPYIFEVGVFHGILHGRWKKRNLVSECMKDFVRRNTEDTDPAGEQKGPDRESGIC